MNKQQLATVLRALDTFEKAALAHGWERDQGSDTSAKRAARLYKAAGTRLRNLLQNITDFDEYVYAPVPSDREPTDDEVRALWRSNGGDFHGPNVEHGTMKEANLLPFLRHLMMLSRRA